MYEHAPYPPETFSGQGLRSAVLENCAAPGIRWHAILEEGEEVGFLVLGHGWVYCHPMCDLHVCQAYVEPGHRGRGLMGEAVRRLVGAPAVRAVSLMVLKANEGARSFWPHMFESMGFGPAPDIPALGDIDEGMEEWHYRRAVVREDAGSFVEVGPGQLVSRCRRN